MSEQNNVGIDRSNLVTDYLKNVIYQLESPNERDSSSCTRVLQ